MSSVIILDGQPATVTVSNLQIDLSGDTVSPVGWQVIGPGRVVIGKPFVLMMEEPISQFMTARVELQFIRILSVLEILATISFNGNADMI